MLGVKSKKSLFCFDSYPEHPHLELLVTVCKNGGDDERTGEFRSRELDGDGLEHFVRDGSNIPVNRCIPSTVWHDVGRTINMLVDALMEVNTWFLSNSVNPRIPSCYKQYGASTTSPWRLTGVT